MAKRRKRRRKLKILNIIVLTAVGVAIAAGAWFGLRAVVLSISGGEKPGSQVATAGKSESVGGEVDEESGQSVQPVSQVFAEDTLPIRMKAEEFLSAVRRGNRGEIQDYADYNALFALQEGQNPEWILQQILMRMRGEILSVNAPTEEAPDTASVEARFTNIDMGKVLPEYYRACMELEYNNNLVDEPLGAEALNARYNEIFAGLAAANAENRVERQALLEFARVDNTWTLKANPELGDALLGGYITAQRAMAQGGAASGEDADAGQAASSAPPESQSAPPESSLAEEDRPDWAAPEDVINDSGMVVPRE